MAYYGNHSIYFLKILFQEKSCQQSNSHRNMTHYIFSIHFFSSKKFAPRPYYINYFQINKRLHFSLIIRKYSLLNSLFLSVAFTH